MNGNAWILAQTGLPVEFFFPQCYVADKAAWESATHVVKWPTLTFLVKICNFCLKSILIYRQNNLHSKRFGLKSILRELDLYDNFYFVPGAVKGTWITQWAVLHKCWGKKNDSRHDKRNLVPLILGDPHVESTNQHINRKCTCQWIFL